MAVRVMTVAILLRTRRKGSGPEGTIPVRLNAYGMTFIERL